MITTARAVVFFGQNKMNSTVKILTTCIIIGIAILIVSSVSAQTIQTGDATSGTVINNEINNNNVKCNCTPTPTQTTETPTPTTVITPTPTTETRVTPTPTSEPTPTPTNTPGKEENPRGGGEGKPSEPPAQSQPAVLGLSTTSSNSKTEFLEFLSGATAIFTGFVFLRKNA